MNYVDPTGHSIQSLQDELDELKRIRTFRITLRDNYAKNKWNYAEGSDMFNLLDDASWRNRGIVKYLNKQIWAKEDELETFKDIQRKLDNNPKDIDQHDYDDKITFI